MMPADDAAFAALTGKISREAGLSLDAYKDKCLRRRIAVRMRACGVHTFSDYQTVLDRSPAEYGRLKDAITINHPADMRQFCRRSRAGPRRAGDCQTPRFISRRYHSWNCCMPSSIGL